MEPEEREYLEEIRAHYRKKDLEYRKYREDFDYWKKGKEKKK